MIKNNGIRKSVKYYVYMYIDQDNCPFYIGKGKGTRRYPSTHLKGRSHTTSKIKSIGVANVKVYSLHEGLTEEDAFYWEKYWVKYFGRIDIGTGQLANHTDGGEGSGHSVSIKTRQQISRTLKGHGHSEETRRKISATLTGYTPSEKTKQQISEANKGRIPWNKGKKTKKLEG